jgi:hypothetical protein
MQSTAADGRGVVSLFRLRDMPFEDLYFHSKRIDNSRLVRQADPRSTGECWSTIGAVCAVAVVLITTLVPRVASVVAGYNVQLLKQDQQKLLNERRVLEVEEARLLSAERLAKLADAQHLVDPRQDQIIHLNEVPGGTVAQIIASGKQ